MNYLLFKVLCYATEEQLKQLPEDQLLMVLREKEDVDWSKWMYHAVVNDKDKLTELAIEQVKLEDEGYAWKGYLSGNEGLDFAFMILGHKAKLRLIKMLVEKRFWYSPYYMRGAFLGGDLDTVKYLYETLADRVDMKPPFLWYRHADHLLEHASSRRVADYFIEQEKVAEKYPWLIPDEGWGSRNMEIIRRQFLYIMTPIF